VLILATKKSLITKPPCCSGCAKNPGKPCCGKKKRLRIRLFRRPAFTRQPSGLLLPRHYSPIKSLLQYPREIEWSGGRIGPLMPALMPAIDMSSCPCCAACCSEIPDTIYGTVTFGPFFDCCGAPMASPVITLSKTSDFVWEGSGQVCDEDLNSTQPNEPAGFLSLVFTCLQNQPDPISSEQILTGAFYREDPACSEDITQQAFTEECVPLDTEFSTGWDANSDCCFGHGDASISVVMST
jgi:hypothetical protein